jgi:thioredoxin reductase (NADPH)
VFLIERGTDIGGQLHMIHGPIENYLGRRAENGAEMLGYFRDSIGGFDFTRRLATEVVSIDVGARTIRLAGGDSIDFRFLILATGVRRRRLGIPGEDEFRGKGILESGARDRELVRGKRVVIVGGGDAAIENALILSESASSVTVVHRRNEFTARHDFLQQVESRKSVEFMLDTIVTKIDGDSVVERVEVNNTSTGRLQVLPVDALLIRIGVVPNSKLVRDIADLDSRGYVLVGDSCETSADDLFAIGDVANPGSPTLQTAAGSGAKAAQCCVGKFHRD